MSKALDAKIRIGAETAGALQEIRRLRGGVEELRQQAKAKGSDQSSSIFNTLAEGARNTAGLLVAARQALVGLAGAATVAGTARLADQYSTLSARLRIVTTSTAEFNQALATSRSLSQQYGQPLRETAALYTRLLASVRPLGGGLDEARVATDALLASLKISGASAEEAGSAILQFSQALGAGRLAGEEFNAINEAAPRLLDALAKGLGKPRDELKKLAEEGKLTTSAVVDALRKTLPELARESSQVPQTIGGALQQAKDEVFRFVGAAAEGSRAVVGLTTAITAVGRAAGPIIEVLATLALGLAALKIGAITAQFVGWAAGIASVSAALPVLVTGLRAALAIIGGPVGLVVAVASLAVGWNLLSDAKEKAAGRAADRVRAERDAVQRELDELNEGIAKAGTLVAPQARLNQSELKLKIARLNGELRDIELASARADQERIYVSRAGTRAAESESNLRDPRTVAEFEEEFKTRQRILKGFEDKRAAYIVAKDKEIAAARLAGNADLEKRLLAEKAGALAEQAKAERQALQKLGADAIVTRVAQYREQFDAIAAIVGDSAERELRIAQSKYDRELISTREFFAERRRLTEEQASISIAALEAEVRARSRVIDENRARQRAATNANDRSGFDDAIASEELAIGKLQADLVKLRRDRADSARSLSDEEQRLTSELQRQRQEMDFQTKALNGQLTLADLRLQIENRYQAARQKEFVETGDTVQTDALIAAELRVAELGRLQAQYNTLAETIRTAEDAIRIAVEAGEVGVVEGERRKFDVRAQAIEQLELMLSKMRELAKTPDEIRAVQEAANKLPPIKTEAQKINDLLRGSLSTGFSTLFKDVATGSKTAKDAFKDFTSSVVGSTLDIIGKRLGEKLANSLLPTKGGGWLSDIGSFLASTFAFHSGGVVGVAGRARSVSPLAFMGAPRFHSGGVAGLRSNEMAAVLQYGEEVLTRDDPRHVRNGGGRGGNQVSVAVTVNGMSGNAAERESAGAELGGLVANAVDSAIESWAAKESRVGGRLSNAARGRF